MKVLKVPLKNAEKATNLLHELKLYDKRYLVKRTKMHLLIPVLKKDQIVQSKIPGSSFEQGELQKKIKHDSYQELMKLSKSELSKLPKSYDVIGDIIIIEIPDELVKKEKQIAEALLKTHKNIKTILKKKGIHSGEFRIQPLSFLAGVDKRETIYKENNVKLKFNVEKVYFSPRLSTERKRIYLQVKAKEYVLVMFSGVGICPLVIAKNTKAKKILGIEKNPAAHEAAMQNKTLNKIANVEFVHGDVRRMMPDLKFDRIIMPLPKDAETFLSYAFSASKNGTIIHFYDFQKEILKAGAKVRKACKNNKMKCRILRTVRCGQYSPGKYRVCVDFQIIL